MSAISRPRALGLIPGALLAAQFTLGHIPGPGVDSTFFNVAGGTAVVAIPLVCLLASALELRRVGSWRRCLEAGAAAGSASVVVWWSVYIGRDLQGVVLNPREFWFSGNHSTIGDVIGYYIRPQLLVWDLVLVLGGGIVGLAAGALVKATATVLRRRATV